MTGLISDQGPKKVLIPKDIGTLKVIKEVRNERKSLAGTARLVLYNTKATGCITDKGPWYVSAVGKLSMEWRHETFGKRNVVERWFFYIKHRLKKFYERFPWNAKV